MINVVAIKMTTLRITCLQALCQVLRVVLHPDLVDWLLEHNLHKETVVDEPRAWHTQVPVVPARMSQPMR